jgi:hypothetical protein
MASTKSWRDVLKVHPAAELFPPMSPDELRALGEDIVKHELANPIVLWRADPGARKVPEEFGILWRNPRKLDSARAGSVLN